jgi:hypothetical protein
MAETAAHLVDHVFPPLPLRQWMLAEPNRLRYFLQRDGNGRCTPVSRGSLPKVRGISRA